MLISAVKQTIKPLQTLFGTTTVSLFEMASFSTALRVKYKVWP